MDELTNEDWLDKMEARIKSISGSVDDLLKENWELGKMVSGAAEEEQKLLHYIDNICAIIEYQMPLKEQDRWLEDMIELGYYKSGGNV